MTKIDEKVDENKDARNNKGQFVTGNKSGQGKKGTKHDRTKMKEMVTEIYKSGIGGVEFKSIKNVERQVIAIWAVQLFFGNWDEMKTAAKEISKYLFPTQKAVDVKSTQTQTLRIFSDQDSILGIPMDAIKKAQEQKAIEEGKTASSKGVN